MENTNVTTDAKASFGAGSEASFSDLEAITDRISKKPKAEAKPEAKEKPEAKPERKEASENRESKDKGETSAQRKDAKPKAEAKTEARGEKDQKAEPENKPAKRYKAKDGDADVELSGGLVFKVPVNGVDEDVSLEDLRSNYSGKVYYDKKLSEVDRQRKDVETQRGEIQKLVGTLYDKVTKEQNGEAAFDFLAELTKQDPVVLKMNVLKQQYEQMKPLFEMDEAQRNEWFKQRELAFREGAIKAKESRFAESEAETQRATQLSATQEKYGIDPERYDAVESQVKAYLEKTGQKIEVTPEHVVWAERTDVALQAIKAAAPHLEQHAEFDSIVQDIVSDLVKHPHLKLSDAERILRDTFGQPEDKAAQRLSRKAAEADGVGAREVPRQQQKPADKKPLFFEDV